MKPAWRRTIAGVIAIALGVPTLSSCGLLAPARMDAVKALLSELPQDLPRQEPHAATLLVLPPETEPIYDTTQMAYTIRAYQVAYFSRHEWAETPSQMLQPLLIMTLHNTRYFGAVLRPPYPGRVSYALRTEILALIQDFTAEPAVLQLSLRVQLSDGAGNRIIATRQISLREPMQQKTPDAGVVAANDATAKALREIAKFVLQKAH